MGSKILFYLFIKPISKLPYFILYGIADFFYFLMYYVVGYRKKIVLNNLKNSFPEKTEKERKAIARKFYRYFVDLIFESLKNFSISEQEAILRMETVNPEEVNKYYKEGRSVILCGGHYGNWELWAMAAAGTLQHPVYGIYKRLSNQFFDNKMRASRGRYGLHLLATKDVARKLEEMKGQAIASVYGFDQSPGNAKRAYWTTFLNQETACSYGPEKFALKYNSPVIYVHLERKKRGHYRVSYETLFEDPSKTEYGEIITKINQVLEQDIRKDPTIWLWTHRRWKHKRVEHGKK